MNEEDIEIDVKVYINKKLMNKLEIISTEFDKELGGLLLGKTTEEGILIESIIFPKQTVTGGSVDMDAKDLVEARKQFAKDWGRIIGYWHSHNTLGAFWSAGDEQEHIRLMGKERDFCVFIVSSKDKHRVRLDVNKPFKMTLDNLPLYIISKDRDKLKDAVLKEIKQCIIPEKPQVVYSNDSWKRTFNVNNNKKEVQFYFNEQKHNISVINLTQEQVSKILEKDFAVIKSKELSDNSWIVVINAANLNIANYVKKEINGLLKKDDAIIDYDDIKRYYWDV